MIFGNPVRGTVYLTPGSDRFYRSQRFGCTGFSWEPPLGNCSHFHRAIDISHSSGALGRDIIAPAAGTVIFAGALTDGAHAIVVRHANGYATGYGHVGSFDVHAGQKVSKGQKLGDIDLSGQTTGAHVHFALKAGFSGGVNEFWRDPGKGGTGRWTDPWPLLAQNVTVRPKQSPSDIRIRFSLSLDASAIYAETGADGRIRRSSDGADLGATSSWRKWGGTVAGPSYSAGGKSSSRWERIWLDGKWLYVAALLAQRSAS